MADGTDGNERIVDLDVAGDALPDLIEEAARRGERLVVERGGVRLAVLEPNPRLQEPFGRITRGEAFALLDRIREKFADQSQEDIEPRPRRRWLKHAPIFGQKPRRGPRLRDSRGR